MGTIPLRHSQQDALFDVQTSPPHAGIVYLMTDGYMLKFGWSSHPTPEPRSGQLRAGIIGFQPGTRADEKALLALVARWTVGGEWFRVPDDPVVLHSLWLIVQGMGQWKGVRATEALAYTIANNLRRAA